MNQLNPSHAPSVPSIAAHRMPDGRVVYQYLGDWRDEDLLPGKVHAYTPPPRSNLMPCTVPRTPLQAVRIAMKFDTKTGGDVTVLRATQFAARSPEELVKLLMASPPRQRDFGLPFGARPFGMGPWPPKPSAEDRLPHLNASGDWAL
jgi:hypothetical protein